MNPEKVNQLYNFLADNGVEDIGTDMGFMARMQNIEDRKKLYDYLESNKVEGIGTTFAEFDEILGIEPTPQAKMPSWEDFKEATQRESVEGRLAAARDALKRTTTQDFVAEQMDMPLTDIVQQEMDAVLRPSQTVLDNIFKSKEQHEEQKTASRSAQTHYAAGAGAIKAPQMDTTSKVSHIGDEEYKYLKGQRNISINNLEGMIADAKKLYEEEKAQGNVKNIGTRAGRADVALTQSAERVQNLITHLEDLRKKYTNMVTEADKKFGAEGDLGKGLAEFDLVNFLTAGWKGVLEDVDQVAILQKISNGGQLTPEEQLYAKMFEEQARLEGLVDAQGGTTQGYNIGSGVAESLPFITQMLSTSGVASAVKGGVRKALGAVGREAAKEGAEKSFKKFAGRAISRGIDNLVGSAAAAAVTTPLQAGMYNNYIDNAVNEYMTYGKLTDSPVQRLWKSYADAFTDTFTEHLGGVFTGAAKYTLKNYGANAALGRVFGTFGRRIQPFYRDLLKRTAYNGFVGEFEEEMWANFLSPLMRGDSKEERQEAWREAFSKENIVTTLATTALMSAGFGAGQVVSAADATRKYEKFKKNARNSLANIESRRLEQTLVDIMALPTLQERCQAFANIDWQGDYKSMGHGVDYFYNSILKEVYDGVVKMEDANEVVMPTLRTLGTVIERGSTDVVTAQMDGKPVYIIKGVADDAQSVIVQDMDGNRSQVAYTSLREINSTPVNEVVADLINKEYNAISAQMDAAEQAEEGEFLHEQGLVTPTERARADQFALEEEVMYGDKPATILSIDKNDGTARISVEGGEENMRVNISDLQKMEMAPEVEATEEAEVVVTPTETPTEQTTQEVATPKVEAVLNEAGEVDVVSTGEEQTANYLAQEFETPEDAIGYADDKIAAAQKALKKAQSNDKLPLNIAERKKVIAERKAEIARIESEIAMWEGVKARLTQPQQTEQAPAEVAPEVESAPVAEQATTEEVAEVTAPQAEVEQEEDAEVTTNEQATEKAPAEEDIHTREQVEALEWKAGVVMNEEARNHNTTEALDKLAKDAGVRVAFVDEVVEGGIEGNGLYDPKTKTIYIAKERDDKSSVRFVAGHEMLHHIKTLSPEAYEQYVAAVKAEMGKDFEKQKEYIRKNYRTSIILAMSRRGELGMSADEMEAQIERQMPSDEVLTEEVVADWTGVLIDGTDGFSRFVKKHEGSAMLRVFRNALEHLRTFFTGKNSFERTMQRRLKALDILLDESMGKTPSKAERKALLSIQESANSLVGVHNISLAKLNKAVKMGGLANPSVAVLDIDKSTHEDYGDISLILPSATVDSRLGRNAGTWAGDAWTPTYPQVVKRIDKDEDISRFYKDINKMPDRMRNKVALDWNSYLEDRSAPALAYWFLFEKGNAPEMLTIPSKYPEDIVEQVRNATNGAFSLYQLSPEERMAVVEAFIAQEYNGDRAAYEKALQDKVEKIESRGLSHKSALVRKSAEQDLAAIKEYGFDYDQISDFVREVERDFNHRGEENIEGTIRNAQEYIKENGLQDEFDAWKVELDNRYNVGEYIFNGYTNSGDRKWLPHTIENASKWMKKQGREGSVATFPSFGVFVAVAIPRMTSLASIRKRKSQLGKTEQEFNEFKDKWEPIYYELGQKLQPDAKGYEDYGWWRLIEAVGQKNPQEFIKTQYGIELSEEDMQKFNEMVNAIRTDYPAKYFETKFERPVQLSEFTAAVVPNTTPQEVENTLREAGVAVYEYDKNTEGSRKKVMLEATDSEGVRFALRLSPEEQEIVEKAKADGTYLKAPNGKPTNLTPKQWAQVRTKAFKEWFGDWEKATRIEKLRNSPSIIATGEEHIGKYELNNKSAAEYINSELRGSYTNKDTNEEIKITRKGAFKVTRHDAENEVHLKSIALIPKMLEDAIFITEEINEKGNSGFESYRYYIVGLNMGGVDYTAKLVIGVKNGETYYDHSLTEIEKTNLIDRRDEISSSFTANEDAIFEYKDKRLISILQINSSKVIDANGEPKVVWHGGDFAMTDFVPNGAMHFGTFNAATERLMDKIYGYEVKVERNQDGLYNWSFVDDFDSEYDQQSDNSFATEQEAYQDAFEHLAYTIKPYFLNIKNILRTNDAGDVEGWDEVIDRAKENGFDGVIYKNGTEDKGSDSYLAFSPAQIKSATENVGTFDANNPDVRFSIRTPDTFYSNAEFAVRGIKQEKATPEQWLKMIEKSGGMKAGEDKWLGLSDWLKESKAKTLTKQEVLDYINSNKIVVEDVEYGVQDYMSENEIYESDEYRALEESLLEYEDETPYIDKEKFKELRNKDEDFVDGFDVDYWGEQLLVKNPFAAARYLGISNVGKRINDTRLQYTTNGLTNKREIALVVPTIEPWKADDDIHFGDAGEGRAVAWVRFGETEDEYGYRTLVIDEIQSNRHQEGREKGYISDDVREAQRQYDYLYNKMYRDGLTEDERNRYYFLGEFIKDNYGIVPEAPFDKNWHEVAMKRILRYAAENGYDKVAWTTGDQQAERYDISKTVDNIKSEDNNIEELSDGTPIVKNITIYAGNSVYNLFVDKKGVAHGRQFGDQPLADIVGKPLAEKLMEKGDFELEGDGLRIGGEGMKGFYDKILPNFMNKYGKKWGVKVGEVTMPDLAENNTMHSVAITPGMRESVMQGQPLFSLRLPEYNDRFTALREEYAALDKNDAQAVADFRARKRNIVEAYWSDFAKALGADIQPIVVDSTNSPEVLQPIYDIVKEVKEAQNIKEKMPTFEEFVEYWNNDKEIAKHFKNTPYIILDVKKADAYNTQKSFTQLFLHEYIHDIIDRNVSRHHLLRIWQESATTDYGKALRKGYDEQTSAQLGSEVLTYLITGRANTNIAPLLDYIEGENNILAEDVLTTFGNSLPLRDNVATNILSILRNGYKEREGNQEADEQNLYAGGESRDLRGGAARAASRAPRAQAAQREVVEEDGITLEEVDIPEFDESPKLSLRDPIERLREDNEAIANRFHTEKFGRKFEKKMFNHLADVQRLQENLYEAGVERTDDNDFINKMESVRNIVSQIMPQEYEKFVTPLLKVITNITKEYGFDYNAISDYLAAKHSIEREDTSGIKTMSEASDAVWNRANVEKIVSDFESKVPESVRELLWKGVRNINQRTLNILQKVGVYTSADIEAIQSHNWEYYVPLQGWDTEAEELIEVSKVYSTPNGGVASNNRWQSHIAEGRKTKPYDPLATIVAKLNKAVFVAETNKALQSLYNLVTDATKVLGTEKASYLFKASDAYYRKTDAGFEEVDADEISDEELSRNKKLHSEIKKLYNERKQAIKAKDAKKVAEIDAKIAEAKSKLTIFVRSGEMAIPKEVGVSNQLTKARRVYFYMNGKRMFIQFVNPKYATAIGGQTLAKRNDFERWLAGFTRFLSQSYTTLNPEFSFVTNPIRDFGDAIFTHLLDVEHGNVGGFINHYVFHWKTTCKAIYRAQRGKANPLTDKELEGANIRNRDDRRALAGKYGMDRVQDTLFKWYAENGGVTGYGRAYSVQTVADDLKKNTDKLKKGDISTHANVYKALADSAEIITRYATFLASLDKGESVGQAVSNGRNVSVNFNRKGELSDKLGAGYSFFSASAQGIYKYLTLARKYPKRFALVVGSAIAMGYATNLLIDFLYTALLPDDDGDELQEVEIPLWERLGYTTIPVWRSNGKVQTIRIPKPVTFASFSAIGVLLNELQHQRITTKEAILAAASQMMSSWTYGFSEGAPFWRAAVPTALQPIADIMNNTDAFGREVYRTDKFGQGTPNSELGLKNVIPWMYEMTKALNKATGGNEFKSGAIDINPSVVQYIMQQYAGGFGVLARKTIEGLSPIWTDKVEFEAQNIPMFGRLMYTVEPKSWYPDYDKVSKEFGATALSNAKKQYRAGYMSEEEWRDIAVPAARFKALDSKIKNLIKLRNEYVPSSAEYKIINREINRQRGLVVKIFEEADINNPQSISDIIEKYDPNRRENLTNLYKEYAK